MGSDEDPAYRIVREAIKRKDQNRAGLNSLEHNLFSKDIFLSAGEGNGIRKIFYWLYKSNKLENNNSLSSYFRERKKMR